MLAGYKQHQRPQPAERRIGYRAGGVAGAVARTREHTKWPMGQCHGCARLGIRRSIPDWHAKPDGRQRTIWHLNILPGSQRATHCITRGLMPARHAVRRRAERVAGWPARCQCRAADR